MGRHLTAIFPQQGTLFDQEALTSSTFADVERYLGSGECSDGYLHVERSGHADILLFYQKSMHSAVRIQGGAVSPLTLEQFFSDFKDLAVDRIRMCRTEQGLVLLMAVVLQNTPNSTVEFSPAAYDKTINDLVANKGTAVLFITQGPKRSLVYCREGKPVVLYGAEEESTVSSDVTRRVRDYSSEGGTLSIFTDLQSRRDENASRPMEQLLKGQKGADPFFIMVKQGTAVIARRLFQEGEASFGRDPGNDVVLDHLSVSRQHCVIRWENGKHVVRDCGSSNGTVVNGTKSGETVIEPGSRIKLGDFTVFFDFEDPTDTHEQLQTMFMETNVSGLSMGEGQAQLVLDGKVIPIETPVFTLGKSSDASLKLSGFRMKPVQATIVREAPDSFRLLEVSGGLPVKIAGLDIDKTGVVLQSGQPISIGKHQLVFMIAVQN